MTIERRLLGLSKAVGDGTYSPIVSVKNYGAVGDGVTITDAAMTSTQRTVGTAYVFTVLDIGKVIYVGGAGVAGAGLVTTIQSVSAGVPTLTAAASTTVTGKTATFGTDDTAAIQAAVNAVPDAFFPSGTYIVAGAQQSGTVNGTGAVAGQSWTYTGQILLPARALTVSPRTVRLVGQVAPPRFQWGAAVMPAHQVGAILFSTATSGNVVDVVPDAGGQGYGTMSFSNIHAMFDQITVRCMNNPQCGGLNLSTAGSVSVTRGGCDVNSPSKTATEEILQPTGAGYGLQMPHIGNSAGNTVRQWAVIGFPNLYYSGEHAIQDELLLQYGMTGWRVGAAQHSVNSLRTLIQDCPTGIVGDNTATPIYGHIDTQESHASQWYDTVYTVDDASNALRGALVFNNSNSDSLAVNGAGNLNLMNAKGNGWYKSSPLVETFGRGACDRSYTLGSADKSAHPWVVILGGFGTTGSKGYAPNTGTSLVQANLSRNEYTVYASLTTSATWTSAGIATHIVGAGFYWRAELNLLSAQNTIQLIKTDNSVKTTVITAAGGLTASTVYKVELRCTIDTIALYVNGAQIGTTYSFTTAERNTYARVANAGLYTFRAAAGAGDDGGTRWNSITTA